MSANYLDVSLSNKLQQVLCHCNGKRLLPGPICVTDLLYGETGVMDFGV